MKNATIALLAVAAVLTIGCARLLDSRNVPPEEGSPLEFAVQVSPDVLEFGDTLDIRLAVTNPTSKVWAQQYTGSRLYWYNIHDGRGELIHSHPGMSKRDLRSMEFRPHQTVEHHLSWTWRDTTISRGYYFLEVGLGMRGGLVDDIVFELR